MSMSNPDRDGDGLLNGVEEAFCQNSVCLHPHNPHTDGDGLEVLFTDHVTGRPLRIEPDLVVELIAPVATGDTDSKPPALRATTR